MAAPLPGIEMCVFDAYGTLFDFNSAVARHRRTIGASANALSELWRTKQIQYNVAAQRHGSYAPFWQVTGEALDHCLAAHRTHRRSRGTRAADERLPGARSVSRGTRHAGLPRAGRMRAAILSNGNPGMLEPDGGGFRFSPIASRRC